MFSNSSATPSMYNAIGEDGRELKTTLYVSFSLPSTTHCLLSESSICGIGAIVIPIETFKPQPALLHAEILKK